MDCRLSSHSVSAPPFLPSGSALKPDWLRCSGPSRRVSCVRLRTPRRLSLFVVAAAGPSPCESSSLNSPLVPLSAAGKYLSRVFQNQRQLFHVAVAEELKQLADDRDSAVARMVLSEGSDEASLHRRIVELKEWDCRNTIEDVMYMLILFKFSEIKVPLVPKLSRCIYNGRLEIWPAKDWELESIYSYDVLQMVREHVNTVTGLSPNSSVSDLSATTQVHKYRLSNIYIASVLYGYFLKSVSTRHKLEQILSVSSNDAGIPRSSHQPSKTWPYGRNNLVLGHRGNNAQPSPLDDHSSRKLSCYLMGFDSDTLDKCWKVKSWVAKELIEKQAIALFGDTRSIRSMSKEETDVLTASFSSLKRLFLEAVAFGSFLWDIEDDVDSVYTIRDR